MGSSYLQSPVHNRVFLALRTAPDGSDIFFVTILDISDQDRGEYKCKAHSLADATEFSDSINVEIYSYPYLNTRYVPVYLLHQCMSMRRLH